MASHGLGADESLVGATLQREVRICRPLRCLETQTNLPVLLMAREFRWGKGYYVHNLGGWFHILAFHARSHAWDCHTNGGTNGFKDFLFSPQFGEVIPF